MATKNFRFFDNRQKYLLFVNTCSEKWVIAGRVAEELESLRPKPPAIRLFDAGGAGASRLRNAGLNLADRIPVLKNLLMRHAMG